MLRKKALYEREILLLWWPANSPDLNPIENVRRLSNHGVQSRFPKLKEGLIACIQKEWAKIVPKHI
jgi:transposase